MINGKRNKQQWQFVYDLKSNTYNEYCKKLEPDYKDWEHCHQKKLNGGIGTQALLDRLYFSPLRYQFCDISVGESSFIAKESPIEEMDGNILLKVHHLNCNEYERFTRINHSPVKEDRLTEIWFDPNEPNNVVGGKFCFTGAFFILQGKDICFDGLTVKDTLYYGSKITAQTVEFLDREMTHLTSIKNLKINIPLSDLDFSTSQS